MLITKTPFRVSFCGGGSDLPDFYRRYGGCVLSASINKYMYISVHPYFDSRTTVLKYSKTEIVDDIAAIQHPIFNCVLNALKVSGVEIVCTADIPAGTGLGSSSSFTVGLLHTMSCYQGKYRSKSRLAEWACEVEIDRLNSPIGRQDQYAAAFGGLNFIRFNRDDSVTVEPVVMEGSVRKTLRENLLMYYIGQARSANAILGGQRENLGDAARVRGLLRMCELAERLKDDLEHGRLDSFGRTLHEGWLVKRALAGGITNPRIDDLYDRAMAAGAAGGKLLGAGGGGFLLFYCEPSRHEALSRALGLRPTDFSFECDGSSVIYIGEKYW